MSRDVAVDRPPRAASRPDRPRQVPLPPDVWALTTLSRVDYTDAFLAHVAGADALTSEQWARAFFEEAPPRMRRALVWGWRAIGLRLGPIRAPDRVLGWEVRRSDPDHTLLAARTLLGASAEVLLQRDEDTVLVTTFVRWHHPLGRLATAAIAPRHRRVVAHLLGQAARRHERAC